MFLISVSVRVEDVPGLWLYISQSTDARDDSAIIEWGCSVLLPSVLSSVRRNQNWDVHVLGWDKGQMWRAKNLLLEGPWAQRWVRCCQQAWYTFTKQTERQGS